MVKLEKRLDAFIALGKLIQELGPEQKLSLFDQIENQNNWFTPSQSELALQGIINYLSPIKLFSWVANYSFPNPFTHRRIGIIMAGNLPAVGFHDLLCVLMAGHKAHIKLSSSDQILLPWLVSRLVRMEPAFENYIVYSERLNGLDAYIATGSDNSARYFDYYFGKYPHIIRKNRTSVAIVDGSETAKDWELLAKDVYHYFGLGCRNVSKVFFSNQNQLSGFLEGMGPEKKVMEHHKYLNNYDYNKSIYLINGEAHLDNGHLLLKESKALVSPIAVIYYEIYLDKEDLERKLQEAGDKIQCVVSRGGWYPGSIPFGQAQCPDVDDYADRVDTMEFLLTL
ncbi:MAG: acyl-CoA reductase [Cyclobacteriaceae bacterium]